MTSDNIAIIGRGESVLGPNGNADAANKQLQTETTIKEDIEGQDKDAIEDDMIERLEPSTGWLCQQIKLDNWDPENEKQWEAVGKHIATRNLIASIPNLTCAFGVWLVWSGKNFFDRRRLPY